MEYTDKSMNLHASDHNLGRPSFSNVYQSLDGDQSTDPVHYNDYVIYRSLFHKPDCSVNGVLVLYILSIVYRLRQQPPLSVS